MYMRGNRVAGFKPSVVVSGKSSFMRVLRDKFFAHGCTIVRELRRNTVNVLFDWCHTLVLRMFMNFLRVISMSVNNVFPNSHTLG